MDPPVAGEHFEREYTFDSGTVELLAEVEIFGPLIHLEIVVYPKDAGTLDVGLREAWRALDELRTELRGLGFSSLRITATRNSGAAPGHTIDKTIRLD